MHVHDRVAPRRHRVVLTHPVDLREEHRRTDRLDLELLAGLGLGGLVGGGFVALPSERLGERFEHLEETIRIVEQMWSDDDGPFEGEHFHLAETICLPKPPRGRVPLMIGGQGERKTLRLVAQYADACNLFTGEGVPGVARKLEVLRRHCDDLGRDYDAIRKTILWFGDPVAESDRFTREMEEYAGLGVTLAALMPPLDADPEAWATALVESELPRVTGS